MNREWQMALEAYATFSLIVGRPSTPGTIGTVPPADAKDLGSIDFSMIEPLQASVLKAWREQKK